MEVEVVESTYAKTQVIRTVVAVCALLNVSALLAWVLDLGAFHMWFLFVGLPALVVVASVAIWLAKQPDHDPYLRRAIVAGAIGGLLGTIGYDVFRIPFILGGMRLFAPIDSYGVLMLNASASSQTTGFAGWSYHFTNGIGFGIFYAIIALGRKWPWAVLWGLVLETATILTPFADSYAIRGKWDLIAIAYAAHVAYGIPLGLVVQKAVTWEPRRPLPVPPWTVLAVLVVALLGWLRPTGSIPSRPETVVKDGEFQAQWLRFNPSECGTLTNADDRTYRAEAIVGALEPGGTAQVCNTTVGAHRVRFEDKPYSGGFIIVDDHA